MEQAQEGAGSSSSRAEDREEDVGKHPETERPSKFEIATYVVAGSAIKGMEREVGVELWLD